MCQPPQVQVRSFKFFRLTDEPEEHPKDDYPAAHPPVGCFIKFGL